MRIVSTTLSTLFIVCLAYGCVEQSKDISAADREQLKQYVGTKAPTPRVRLDAKFENKITLLGYDVEPAVARPGEPFTITWYWKAERPLDDGWKIFTHVADATNTSRLNQDGEGLIRRLYQPGKWKAGEFIRDEQRITLPQDWNSPQAIIYLGVYNDAQRLQVTKGPADNENRLRAVTLETGVIAVAPPAEPELPELHAHKTTSPITLDGRLDETVWQNAQGVTGAFVNTMNGEAAEPRAKARVAWDDSNLYVGFEVDDDYLRTAFTERDANLWEEDTVEIMIDPDGDGKNYFELQVSPRGQIFDTRYDGPRQPAAPGHIDWNSNLRAQVQVRGSIGDDAADEGYTVEIQIPFASFAAGAPPVTPPHAGDTWRVNFFVMDSRAEGAQRAVGWSAPRVGDFHTLAKFGKVSFVDPSAAAAAPTAIPAEVPSAAPAEGAALSGSGAADQPGRPRVPPELLDRLRNRVRPQGGLPTDPIPGRPPR